MTDPLPSNELVSRMRDLWKRLDPTAADDDPVGMAMASQILAQAAERLEVLEGFYDNISRGRIPTHRCKVCGALWIFWPPDPDHYVPELRDGSWSLCGWKCGKCCDCAPMGEQIEPLPIVRPAHETSARHPFTQYQGNAHCPKCDLVMVLRHTISSGLDEQSLYACDRCRCRIVIEARFHSDADKTSRCTCEPIPARDVDCPLHGDKASGAS